MCLQNGAHPAGAGNGARGFTGAAMRQMGELKRAAGTQTANGAGAAKKPTRGAQRMQVNGAPAAQSGDAAASGSGSEGPDEDAPGRGRVGAKQSLAQRLGPDQDAPDRGRVGAKQSLAQRLGPGAAQDDGSVAPAAKRLRQDRGSALPQAAAGSAQHAPPGHANGRGGAAARNQQQPAQQHQAGASLTRLLTRATAAAAAKSGKGSSPGLNGSGAGVKRATSREAPAAQGAASERLARKTAVDEEDLEGDEAGQGRWAPGVDEAQPVQGAAEKAALKKPGNASRGLFGAAMAGISARRQGKNIPT